MKVAGVGLRAAATLDSLRDALKGQEAGLAALATLEDKAGHPALQTLAREMSLPIRAIPRASLAGLVTLTRSCRIEQGFGTGSVAEACALAACGPGARIITPRITAPDGLATIALASDPEVEAGSGEKWMRKETAKPQS
ncbi:MAG: cobalamin biosynthesis protein [Proteobacteria bacterium]|nr:cobalamin biosynthesis protein [Pseudomonadota bacterium]